jgi:hypothetical protein
MSMMEEGDEALGFRHEIYWLNGQPEKRLDRHQPHDYNRPTSTGSPAS